MTTPVLIVLVSLGAIFLWGLLAPRSQWRALASWSFRDPYVNEPSGTAFLLHRVVAAIGIASMVVSGVLVYQVQLANRPVSPPPPTTAEMLWGTPVPVVVNRVVQSEGDIPAGLVDQPIIAYQEMIGKTRQPPYLFGLKQFKMRDATEKNGLVGTDPRPGFVALDSAMLVVEVFGAPKCFPHAVVVRESEDTVAVGVYYGQASPKDGSNAANLATCNVLASALNAPTLIPIPLADPLGHRTLTTLNGEAILNVDPTN